MKWPFETWEMGMGDFQLCQSHVLPTQVHQMLLESWCSGASSCTSPGKLAKSLVNGSIESVIRWTSDISRPYVQKISKKQKNNITKVYYFTLLLRYLLHFFLSIEIPVKCEVDGPTSSTSGRWVLGLKAEPDIKWPAVFLFQISGHSFLEDIKCVF